MAGEVVSRESLVRRARHLGADLSRGAVALIGKLQDPHTEGRVITRPAPGAPFMQQARAAMDLHWPRALVDWNDGRLPGPAAARPPLRRSAAREIESAGLHPRAPPPGATRETVPGLALTLALSRYTPEPERLGGGARRVAPGALHRRAAGPPGRGRDLRGDRHLQAPLPDLRRPAARSSPPSTTRRSRRSVRYDEQYQTELVGTLSTYLGHDCNLAATARRSSPTATRCATASTASPSCRASTSRRPTTGRSCRSGSRRCGCWAGACSAATERPTGRRAASEPAAAPRASRSTLDAGRAGRRPPVAHGPPVHLDHRHRPATALVSTISGRPARRPRRAPPAAPAPAPAPRPRHPASRPPPARSPARRRRRRRRREGGLAQPAVGVEQERVLGRGPRRGRWRHGARRRRGSCTPRSACRGPAPRREIAVTAPGALVQGLLGRRLHEEGGPRRGRQPHAAGAPPSGGQRRRDRRARPRAPGHGAQVQRPRALGQPVQVALQQRHAPALGAHRLEEALTPAHRRVVDRERRSGRVHQRPRRARTTRCVTMPARVPGRRSRSVHAADGTKGTRSVA